MSQQPPWETHIQPGWGVPQPPENPPQQPQPPQQGGGWNQGSYAPPQPQQMPPQPQYPPPPSQSGAGQYPGFGQPPPPPQFTPPLMPGQPYQDQPPPKNGNRRTIVFAVIGTVAIVGAAVGIYLATNKSSSDSTGKTTSATTSGPASPSAPEASTSSFPDNSYTGSASGTASAAPPSSAAAGGGASLDSAATDKTPFTQAGMVATTFTDSKKVVYTLKAAGPKPCDKVGDALVEPIVKSAKCTDFMAASWTDPDGRIIVSAMIIPYPDAPTATGIYQKLGVAHTGDYNQWCPPAPQPGADACTKLAKAGGVTREGKFGSFHRYMLITTAVYTDLRNDQSQKDWLVAAADGAFQNTLPGQ